MKRVLVTYASEHGSTAQIAQTIGHVLRQFDLEVTTRRVELVDKVDVYEAIVLGSAIYSGNWLPEARNFLETYYAKLASLPFWIFSSGPTGSGSPERALDGELVPACLMEGVAMLRPRGIRVFNGKIDLRRFPPKDRELIKAASVPRGDYRDWAGIKQWAREISLALTIHAIAVPIAED